MKNLPSLLIERGAATMRQVEEAMAKQVLYGGDLASHVLEQVGPGGEEALLDALAASSGLTAAAAGPLPLSSPRAAQVVATELALRHLFYPLSLDEHGLRVAVAAPLPEEVEGDLFFVLSVPARQLITCRIRVRQALARDFGLPLEPREQRVLTRLEGRPRSPSTVPPATAVDLAPPSLRVVTRPLPADLSPSPLASSVGSPGGPPSDPGPGSPAWPQLSRGLVRWMQRASQPGLLVDSKRPRSRRRGPMPLGTCEEALGQAQSGEEVLQTFFEFAQQYFVYSALFVVHGDLAEGRDAYGPGADRDRVTGVGVPLDLPSCLAYARNRRAPVSVSLQGGLDASLTSDLGRAPRGAVLVVPVLIRQRCVALLYADDGEASVELTQAAEVIAAAALTGGHLERLAMARRRQHHPAPAESVVVPEMVRRTATLVGPAPPSLGALRAPAQPHRQQRSEALARALGLRDEMPRLLAPPPTLASPLAAGGENNPFRRITASFQGGTSPAEVEEPVPATLAAARGRAVNPGATDELVSEGDLDDDELVQSALREMLASPPLPTSERRSYRPPVVPPSRYELPVLPSVIVDLDEEQLVLIERLVSEEEGDTDTLLSEVLAGGVRLVPALLARLPGPLRVERDALVTGAVKPSQGGTLLRALAQLRRTALPFVVVQSGHSQPGVRLWATLLLGELPFPETVNALIPRLLDADPEVARAAATSARLLRSSEAVFGQLLGELRRLAAAGSERPEQRAAAASLVNLLSA